MRQLQPQVFQSDVQAGSKLIEMSKIPGWKPLHPLDATIVQVNTHPCWLLIFKVQNRIFLTEIEFIAQTMHNTRYGANIKK